MVFQCFFPIQPLPLNEWFCGSPLTSMVYQWFWEKLKLVHKKGQKKGVFVQQIPRGKQSLDILTWPNVMHLHIFRWASLASLASSC